MNDLRSDVATTMFLDSNSLAGPEDWGDENDSTRRYYLGLADSAIATVREALFQTAADWSIDVTPRLGNHALAPSQSYQLRPFVVEIWDDMMGGADDE